MIRIRMLIPPAPAKKSGVLMSSISDGAASGMSRGVLVTRPMNEGTMFRATDYRVRCKFTISLYDELITGSFVIVPVPLSWRHIC
jgi:hypothetical protein